MGLYFHNACQNAYRSVLFRRRYNSSRLTYIQTGTAELAAYLNDHPEIKSVAVPKLGCGLGGLDWQDVCPVLELHLSECTADIYLFGDKAG